MEENSKHSHGVQASRPNKDDHNKGGHDDDHSHNHSHVQQVTQDNQRQIALAAILTGLFMVVELVGGLISGSLALIADAGHMLTDFAALCLAWIAFALSRKPASDKLTYGYDRFTVLAAFVNALTLIALSIWIIIEALERLRSPVEVMPNIMLWVAVAGLAVNMLVLWILSRADRENLNIRGAILHVMGDLLGSIGAIAAAIIIMLTGWMPIDPILSVFVSVLILNSAVRLIKDTSHILLEGAPQGMARSDIIADLKQEIDGITDITHMHIWSVTQDRPMATLHVEIGSGIDAGETRRAILTRLDARYHLEHVTLDLRRAN